ncbi:ATP-binding protein [Neobacillus muris]|uniref:ATP-binding protein n=1 Tax=Neobacillus muris TaxID=2941334 RepID=UPI00203F4F3F|nr:ATP-binding protein [Neobacillus muris]
MKEGVNSPRLIFEEKKAIKLFLWLFYICFISYEVFWYFVLPNFTDYGGSQFPGNGLGFWFYFGVLCILPVSIFLYLKGNPYIIKYFVLASYVIFDVVDNLVKYLGSDRQFASGNIVELLFLFISPIFVNKKYFWTVTFCIVGKYLFLGIILNDPNVLSPIAIIVILLVLAYIFLTRFYSYINSLTLVHEELRHKEKLAVMGQMAMAIGHEIRNPISSLKGFLQLQQENHPNTNEYYPIMIQEIDRINNIVNDLMYIGKPRKIKFEKASIKEIIGYTVALTNQQAINQGIIIETEFKEAIPMIDCDESQLKQVLINLIKNAIEAMPDGGTIKIRAMIISSSELQITINDEGYGISNEALTNLGEPFYSTKKEGTGLGLMVTNQIIKEHRGEITFKSNLGIGTMVTIILPISSEKD